MEKLKYSPHHEQIVLGTMLKDRKTRKRLANTLSANNFHTTRHKTIFAGLVSLVHSNLEYTPATLTTLLPDTTDWGDKDYLDKIERMGNAANIDHHVDEMRWDVARVETFEDIIPQIATELKDPRADRDEVLQLLVDAQSKILNSQSESAFEGGSGLASQHSATILARKVGSLFRTSGYMDMDKKLVHGFAAGKLSVIAGTPSAGKSTFAANMARKQARKWKVGFLAWESGSVDTIDIFVSSGLKIPLEKMIKLAHMLTAEEQESIDDYVATILGDDKISFLKEPPDSIFEGAPWDVNKRVLDWVFSKIEGWGRDIIYWDLFEKRFPTTDPAQILLAINRVQREIKPDRLNVHMCLLHQLLLKEVERRQDKRPTRDVLKGTAGYLEAPDLVLTVYRPALYEPGVDDNTIEIDCLKQRAGPWPWRMIGKWQGEYVRIPRRREGKPIVVKQESSKGDIRGRI
jgi:replicative DNA helicase